MTDSFVERVLSRRWLWASFVVAVVGVVLAGMCLRLGGYRGEQEWSSPAWMGTWVGVLWGMCLAVCVVFVVFSIVTWGVLLVALLGEALTRLSDRFMRYAGHRMSAWLWLKSKPLRLALWLWAWGLVFGEEDLKDIDAIGPIPLPSWFRRATKAVGSVLDRCARGLVTPKEMEEYFLSLAESEEAHVNEEGTVWAINGAQRRVVVMTLLILAGLFAWYNLGYSLHKYLRPSGFFYGVAVPVALLGIAVVVALARPKRPSDAMKP
jgi:hypothetical protein